MAHFGSLKPPWKRLLDPYWTRQLNEKEMQCLRMRKEMIPAHAAVRKRSNVVAEIKRKRQSRLSPRGNEFGSH